MQAYYENRVGALQELVVKRFKQGFIYPWECNIMAIFIEKREDDAEPFATFLVECLLQLLTQLQRSEKLLIAIGWLGRSLCRTFYNEVTARRQEIVKAALSAAHRVNSWPHSYDAE